MLVRDIMTRDVITVKSDTYVLDAERIMESHKIGRLPIVDKGKLVGVVTKDDVLKASPSSTTSFNQRQLFYLMSKLTVKEIMKTTVVTVTPETTIEKAVAIAQKNRIGSLPVVKGDRVVGILTTNDIFYKVLNPLLGIGETGARIIVYNGGNRKDYDTVMDCVDREGVAVRTFWIPPHKEQKDLILHIDTDDATTLIARIKALGYKADIREFIA
ncbi:MAG: acetoin dehydrogenase [Syntrophus sp. (in: bacteria)]|nr:acetoin dehydrogenase [Syntrophus sp. (in: bacteria)]